MKLRRANGALSKLRHYIPLKTLVNIYHAIFSSHMRYACQVWGLCDNVACHRILTLQKCALRLITFSAPRSPSNPIFSDLGILKFFNLVEVLNILFVHQLFNVDLPEGLMDTFDLAKSVIHSIQGGHAWAFLKSLQLTPKLMVFTPFQGCQFNSGTTFSRAFLTLISQKFFILI